ncbi:hypothetical protein, partial [Ancylomarina euxinus]
AGLPAHCQRRAFLHLNYSTEPFRNLLEVSDWFHSEHTWATTVLLSCVGDLKEFTFQTARKQAA